MDNITNLEGSYTPDSWDEFYEKIYSEVVELFPELKYFVVIITQNFLSPDLDKESFYYTGAAAQYFKMKGLLPKYPSTPVKKKTRITEAWNYLMGRPSFSVEERDKGYVTLELKDKSIINGTLHEYFKATRKNSDPRQQIIVEERFTFVKYFQMGEKETDYFTSYQIKLEDELRGALHIIYDKEDKQLFEDGDINSKLLESIQKIAKDASS